MYSIAAHFRKMYNSQDVVFFYFKCKNRSMHLPALQSEMALQLQQNDAGVKPSCRPVNTVFMDQPLGREVAYHLVAPFSSSLILILNCSRLHPLHIHSFILYQLPVHYQGLAMAPLFDQKPSSLDSKSPIYSQHPLVGSRYASTTFTDKLKYRTPPLLSSSMRARSSPKLIHGNSPLLQSWDDSPEEETNNGRFDDADYDETTSESQKQLGSIGSVLTHGIDLPGPDSPSSRLLQEQLRNAVRAVQELQEAVEKQKSKRDSLSEGTAKRFSIYDFTGPSSPSQQDMTPRSRRSEGKQICIDNLYNGIPCLEGQQAIGLGLNLPTGKVLKRTSSTIELLTSTSLEDAFPIATQKPSKRYSNGIACNSTSTAASPSKGWTMNSASNHAFTPSHTYSPIAHSTAPNTPALETATSNAIAATPVISSEVDTVSTQQTTTNTNGANSKSSSAFEYSSHHVSNTLIAGASVTAAGALLLLAAVVFVLLKQRRRKSQHRNKMDAVLDKVSSYPSADDKKGDDNADDLAEKGIAENVGVMAFGAITRSSHHPERTTRAHSTPNLTSSPPQELQMISPWLHYDMQSHPFASTSSQSDRYSPDLAYAGIVGQETSKDHSFTWNFPKLSVPPAAARAMGTSHYVKKRMTLPRKSMTSPRLSASTFDAASRPYPPSIPEGISESASTANDSNVQDIRTSTSSEVVDPEIDHLRRSFCLAKEEGGSRDSPTWIRSARRYFGSRPDMTASTSSSHRSISRPIRRHSDASILDTSLACVEAQHSVHNDLGLPSLSIANSSIVDAREATPFTSPSLMRKISRSKWTRSERSMAAPRILSSESEDSHCYRDRIMTRPARRMSHSEALQAINRPLSFDKALPRTPEGNLEEPKETAMVLNRALHRFDWTSDATDTEDESREGYEAEVEIETEYGSEMPHARIDDKQTAGDTSRPVITLTSSEEEGQLERRISLGSSTVHGSAQQHTASVKDDKNAESYANILDSTSSEEDEDDLTIIYHSFSSKKDLAEQTSNLDRPDAVNCLLSDDFPTIPEWVPINGALRNLG